MLKNSGSTCLLIVIHSFFIFNLLLLQAFHVQRRYVHLSGPKTWSEAQIYCRKNHIDLATFRDGDDFANNSCRYRHRCWIGLYRDKSNPKVWHWSDGKISNFRRWGLNQPNNAHGNENCVATGTHWHDLNCLDQSAFLCYDDSVLVKENKTWEGALEHCRKKRNYDLPLMDFDGDNLNAKKVILDAQTPEVWIGLRFLAGEWLWVNGRPLREKLPVCPAPAMHCGTMSKTGQLSPQRNCLERRNFLCSKDLDSV